ncbi:MAG: exodeoxyribonuclease V subunit alpha [Polyangiaceae bacterium]|nr:exodeoxyribonuclease V subunit alpha [Polyangiaceae bacterium]
MNQEPTTTLHRLASAGVLAHVDLHVAETLCRLAGESNQDVMLAAALASRAPRFGHICVELDRVPSRIEVTSHGEAQAQVVQWPSIDAWLAALRRSPIVREAYADATTPLVLDGSRLYLDRYWGYQRKLVDELHRRATQTASVVDPVSFRTVLTALFPPSGTGLDRQRLAAIMAVLRGLTVICGGPGTGKTTTVQKILALLLSQSGAAGAAPWKIALAAPTGKAAARLQESIREGLDSLPLDPSIRAHMVRIQAFTLHRLLRVQHGTSTRFVHDADNRLPHDVVVVDEASMVSFAMMARLFGAVRDDARLILLGDRDQLASVEAGAVLGDLCGPEVASLRLSRAFAAQVHQASGDSLEPHATLTDAPGIWDCMVQLDRFFRFGADSGIGEVARAISRAHSNPAAVVALLRGDTSRAFDDVELRPLGPDGSIDGRCKESVVQAYAAYVRSVQADAEPSELFARLAALRVLCAHRSGRLGVHGMNVLVESWLREALPDFSTEGPYYLARPVLVTENDYGIKLYNGDVGVVVRHPHSPDRRAVVFPTQEGGYRYLSPNRLPPCEPVFAMSIHKSQGSQFGHAVVVLPTRPSPILTRELIYTAVTRARHKVTMIAEPTLLEHALAVRVQRASGLRPMLWSV